MPESLSPVEMGLAQPRLFTVDEYYRMASAGIFHPDERVELIQGRIAQLGAIGRRDAAILSRLVGLFLRGLGDQVVFRPRLPVRLDQYSEPEPDLCLLRPREDFYAQGHPGAADVLLLVEIADTSLLYDSEAKLPLYSAFSIPEVWIVDLQGDRLEVYRDPSPRGYLSAASPGPGESVSPEAFPDLTLNVADILLTAPPSTS